jgi:hypothetical protein
MQPSESLRHEVLASYTAISTHDQAYLRGLFTGSRGAAADDLVDDLVMIGTCEHDWYTGSRAVDALLAQFAGLPDLAIEPGELGAYEHGDVGWFAGRPVLKATGMPATTARMTGVAVRIDGRWRAVQSHLSLPVPDEVSS